MPNAQFYPEPVVGVARPPGRRGPMPPCPMPNSQCPITEYYGLLLSFS
ncbi:MAG: hypothetical protein F6J93_04900 [Oscillatoria sp. SIO1A7]|nr:hypothetical protein [Oscillatoria sp. SIO1A7]